MPPYKRGQKSFYKHKSTAADIIKGLKTHGLIKLHSSVLLIGGQYNLPHTGKAARQLPQKCAADAAALEFGVNQYILHIDDGLPIANAADETEKPVLIKGGEGEKGISDSTKQAVGIIGVCGPADT